MYVCAHCSVSFIGHFCVVFEFVRFVEVNLQNASQTQRKKLRKSSYRVPLHDENVLNKMMIGQFRNFVHTKI